MMRGSTERGSIFVLILVGIALFAGLSYAISRGSRSGTASLSNDQARLAAQEIISYANTVQKAVQTLRLRGCSDVQVSAENAGGAIGGLVSYVNSNAPSDKSCHIFDPAGGQVLAKAADQAWHGEGTANTMWLMNAANYHTGLGSDAPELSIVLPNLKQPICKAINTTIGIANIPTAGSLDDGNWNGTYHATPSAFSLAALAGKTEMCFLDPDGTQYKYVRVLIVR